MSFLEDCARFGDQLAKLVDAGVPVKEAAVAVGLSRDRCYAILRAIGRPAGQARGPGKRGDQRGVADRDVIVAVFDKTGSINQAAKACRVSHSVARRILVVEGLVTTDMAVYFCDPASPWQRGSNENTYWCRVSRAAASLTGEVSAGLLGDSENTCRRPSVDLSTAAYTVRALTGSDLIEAC